MWVSGSGGNKYTLHSKFLSKASWGDSYH